MTDQPPEGLNYVDVDRAELEARLAELETPADYSTPQVVERVVPGYTHCPYVSPDGEKCPGFEQQPADVLHRTVIWRFGHKGHGPEHANRSQIENSMVYELAADPSDIPCPTCGHPRDFSTQQRPQYPRRMTGAGYGLSGSDKALAILAAKLEQQPDDRLDELKATVAKQEKMLRKLGQQLADKPTNGNEAA
jgi:hypothetical protein